MRRMELWRFTKVRGVNLGLKVYYYWYGSVVFWPLPNILYSAFCYTTSKSNILSPKAWLFHVTSSEGPSSRSFAGLMK